MAYINLSPGKRCAVQTFHTHLKWKVIMALLYFWMAVPLHLAVVYLASGVASLIFLRAVFRAVFTPLRSVPGPFLARFSRLWYLYKLWEGNFEKVNIELHRKYGTWFGSTIIHVTRF